MLKICVSFLTHSRESFSCSKKEISIGPHVWSIKMIKLGKYFFLKIDYCTNCEKKQQLRKKLNRNRSVWENMELLLTYISIMSSELLIHMELHSEFFHFMKGQKDKGLQGESCIEFVVRGQVQKLEYGQRLVHLQFLPRNICSYTTEVAPPLRLRLNGQIVLKTMMLYFQILSCAFALI